MFTQYWIKRLPTALSLRIRIETLEKDLCQAQQDAAETKVKLQKLEISNEEAMMGKRSLQKHLKEMNKKYFFEKCRLIVEHDEIARFVGNAGCCR